MAADRDALLAVVDGDVEDDEADSDFRPSENDESSEAEEDEEEDEDEEVEVADWNEDDLRRLEAEVRELKDKLVELQQQLLSPDLEHDVERQKQLLRAYQQYLQPQRSQVSEKVLMQERNLLYVLASGSSREESLAWLIKHLVEEYPALLEECDESNRNSLLVAITREKHDFIKAVLDSNIDPARLAKVIESAWLLRENSLHTAITKDLDPGLTIKLIEKASKTAFGDQDQGGLTPLHLAVEYKRCTKSKLGVVLALIKHGDVAFDRRTEKPGNLSVYQYHFESRRKYEKEAKEDAKKLEKKKKKASSAKDTPGSAPNVDEKKLKSAKDGVSSAVPDAKPKEKREDDPFDKKRREELSKLDAPPKLTRSGTFDMLSHNISSPTGRDAPRGLYLANETRLYAFPKELPPVIVQPPPGSDFGGSSEKGSDAKAKRPKLKKAGRSSSRTARPSFAIQREPPDQEVAERVAMELQLHYLRSTFQHRGQSGYVHEHGFPEGSDAGLETVIRSHDSAVKFLYGDNKADTQICFEFPPYIPKDAEKITFSDFEASYRGLKFDKVLQYVEFRSVELKTLPARRTTESSPGAGRKDMIRFFDWLWNKEVRNIIRVSVEDRSEVPHSDEAIETSLQRYNFEVLDWRKVDIDPRVILVASKNSNLRELHLWWSGNNGILRAWSEPEGLGKLPNLVDIHIHQTKNGLDSSQRTAQNLEEFKQRLRKGRVESKLDPVTVYYDKQGDKVRSKVKGHLQAKDTDGRVQIDTHRWLTIMDKFADGIYALNPPKDFPQDYLTHPSLPPELRRDVTVALIDDGVNFMHKSIADKIENGRSFDNAYDDPDLGGVPDPFHGSTTGHGTYMAYMIGRVCPGVKIFVCKLNVLRREGGEKASFTAKSAADAVEFAVNRGFDIISMSWTVQKSLDPKNNNAEDIDRLERVLKSATERDKMLIFCSAPDIGMSSEQTLSSYYPFGSTAISNDIFKIGAAKADGTTYGWTGDSRSVDFILPGHNVELRGDDRITEEDDIPKTGSSVATALAAGLAALIIHSVRLGAIYNHHRRRGNDPNVVSEESLRAIKRFRSMKEAFMKVGWGFSGQGRKDRNLDVDNFFKEPGNYIGKDSGYSDEDKWVKITQLARDLVSWNTQSRAAQK